MRHAKTRKLFPLYEGPFRIQSEVNPNAYKVARISGEIIGTFNSRQLKPHRVPTWKPDEPRQSTQHSDSQPREPSISPDSRNSGEIDSQFVPNETSESDQSQPGPSPRRRRGKTIRLSALARKLSGSNSETTEYYIQAARTYKIENQTESPPNSDDTWELVRIPRNIRKNKNFSRQAGARAYSENESDT